MGCLVWSNLGDIDRGGLLSFWMLVFIYNFWIASDKKKGYFVGDSY